MSVRLATLSRLALKLGAGALAFALLVSCAGLPEQVERIETHAIANPESTELGQIVAASTPANAPSRGESGFRLLRSGPAALEHRIALIDHAQRSLDLQYYIIHNDESVRLIAGHLIAAAERGVRVRVLVDDFNTVGADAAIIRFASHPGIEVRLFNPFGGARGNVVGRLITGVGELKRLNRRMHNKLFIADNAMAITGGRNLGDQYFEQGADRNFLDLDVLAAGAIVMDLSASFDTFWNSSLAYPAADIIHLSIEAAGPPTVHALAPSNSMAPEDSLESELRAGRVTLEWAPSRLLADRPDKVEGATRIEGMMLDQVIDLLRSAQTEVILVSPYFIPAETGMTLVREHRTRGVSVRVLTNSLASTDAPAAHIGYARYRLPMLEQGVELNELRPSVEGPRPNLGFGSSGSSRASLHTKLIDIDRRMLFIGSMNLDPRSSFENTEIGLVIDSPALAQRVAKVFDDIVGNEDVWRLTLAPDRSSILWHSGSADGHETTQTSEPDAGLWLRLELFFLGHLVPESLL